MTTGTKGSDGPDKELKAPTKGDGGRGLASSGEGLASDIPAAQTRGYYPDELILYGVKLNQGEGDVDNEVRLNAGEKWLQLSVFPSRASTDPLKNRFISISVIYGYAFEGHCYRLDRPKIFIIDDGGEEAKGCGFDSSYKMWRIRARSSLMELSMSYDLAEVLILEANLPGSKTPNTYGNHMKLAHRGGKLDRSV